MSSSYTSLLKFAKPGLGDTGWGTTVNGGFTDMVEQALTGAIDVAVTAGGTVSLPAIASGASSDARNQFLTITGILTSVQTATVQVPPGAYSAGVGNYKLYFVKNSAGGAVTVETSGGTGVVIPNGASMALRVTNTGVEVVADQFVNLNASGNVTVAGTTTLAALTASGNVSFDGGTFVFNESGADKDARFEGDTDANLLFLDASTDRVGIGTATPAAKLAIDAGANALAVNFNSTDANGVYTRFQNSGTSIGDLGAAASVLSSGVAGDFAITSRSGNLVFGTGTNERMRLTNSGELLVATTNTNFSTSDGIRFIPTGSASASFVAFTNGGNGGTNLALVNSNGSTAIWNAIVFQFNTTAVGSIACTPTTTAYNQSSDRRLKTAVAPAADAGALLDAVQVVEFDWKVGGHVRYGVIAQDLHLIAPEVVTPGDSNEEVERPWGVDYSKLVPMLIKEVQSLRARVAALEAK